ncbi:hypothetical protein ABK040_011342 [Willaertia magna]
MLKLATSLLNVTHKQVIKKKQLNVRNLKAYHSFKTHKFHVNLFQNDNNEPIILHDNTLTISRDKSTAQLVAKKLENVQIISDEYSPEKGIFPYRVLGNETVAVEFDLNPNERIRGETGSLVFMEDGIDLDTSTGGGVTQGLKRMLTGDTFFITDFVNNSQENKKLILAANFPSKLIPIKFEEHGGSIICQKGAFLAGSSDTTFDLYAKHSIMTGIFGGEGFILQELKGNGMALLRAGGSLFMKELKVGEKLKLSPGSLVAFENTVQFDIERLPGVKNMIFGGNGIFLATVQGPGLVWIQSLPFSKFVDSIADGIGSGSYGLAFPIGGGSGGGASTAAATAAGTTAATGQATGAAAGGVGSGVTNAAMNDNKGDNLDNNSENNDLDNENNDSWFSRREDENNEVENNEEEEEESGGGGWFSSIFGSDEDDD